MSKQVEFGYVGSYKKSWPRFISSIESRALSLVADFCFTLFVWVEIDSKYGKNITDNMRNRVLTTQNWTTFKGFSNYHFILYILYHQHNLVNNAMFMIMAYLGT